MRRFLFSLLLAAGAVGLVASPASAEMQQPEFFDTFQASGGDVSTLSESQQAELRAYLAGSGLERSGPVDLELLSLSLDRDAYQKGDTALVAVSWDAPSIQSFIETDAASYGADAGMVNITASSPCTDSRDISASVTDREAVLSLSVTSDCALPAVTVSFTGDDDRYFGEWTVSEPSISVSVSSGDSSGMTENQSQNSGFDLNTAFITLILALLLISVVLIVVKSRKGGMRSFAFFFLLTGLLPVMASAQNEEPLSGELIVLAEIEARNFDFVSQDGNEISVSFTLANEGDTVQPDVRYAIEAWTADPEDENFQSSRAHVQVFDETFPLTPGERIERSVTYAAPSAQSGFYDIRLVSSNSRGLPLASATLGGPVRFDGSGISILTETCFANVEGIERQYMLREGADLSSEETLTMTCLVRNDGEASMATPMFSTHERTVFGRQVSEESGEARTIPTEISEQTFTIPVASDPQAYDVVVALDDGSDVPSSAVLHYVIQGASATVQNVRLDQADYMEGDMATVSLFVSGVADQFPGARSEERTLANPVVTLTLTDGNGKSCAEPMTQALDGVRERVEMLDVTIPVTSDCQAAGASLSVADGSDMLDTYEVEGAGAVAAKRGAAVDAKTLALFVVVAIILLIILIFLLRSKGGGRIGVFVFLLLGAVALFDVPEAEGATYSIDVGVEDVTFSVNLNKSEYAPGEIVQLDVSDVEFSGCGNMYHGNRVFYWDINVEPTTSTPAGGKPAPSTAGSHNARFMVIVYLTNVFLGTTEDYVVRGSLPFTVTAPTPDPPSTPSGISSSCNSDGTRVTLSWNSVSGATSYLVRLDRDANSWSGNCNSLNSGDKCDETTSRSITYSITPDTNYAWWVHGYNSSGWGPQATGSFNCPAPPAAVHGACGPADGGTFSSRPSSGLCASGTASSVSGSGPWYWACNGQNGGSTDSCSAEKSAPASYSCTGSIPGNASRHDSEEESGLTSNTSWQYSLSDTSRKCQYECDSGYTWNGSSCVSSSSSYSCTGSIPGNASPWGSDESTGLTYSRPWYYTSYDSAAKCQFRCDTGYAWNGSSCVSSAPAPYLSFWANPTNVESGSTSTLRWNSMNVSSCEASGDWNGSKITSGSEVVGPLTSVRRHTYYLRCSGAGGSVTRRADVNVTASSSDPAPTLTLSANPASIERGETSTLTWYSENTTSCIASGGWSGAQTLSGSQSVSPTTSTTYHLFCSGPGGLVERIATVAVTDPVNYSCTGSIPSNASRHDSEEESGLTSNTSWQYSSSDTSRKCQYACDTGFEWNGSSCEFIPPPEDPEDPSGSNAGTNWIEVTPGE